MFVTVFHNTLIVRLVKYGLEEEIKVVGKLAGQPDQNNCHEPNWRSISSVVSQGLILKQILFNVFISYRGALSKFRVAHHGEQSMHWSYSFIHLFRSISQVG